MDVNTKMLCTVSFIGVCNMGASASLGFKNVMDRSFTDYTAYKNYYDRPEYTEALGKIFNVLDKDRNGYIDGKEIPALA